jgi:hypothetical protein
MCKIYKMEKYEEFKREIDKFIDFLNNRMKTYEFDSGEEYDAIIDKAIIEYYILTFLCILHIFI